MRTATLVFYAVSLAFVGNLRAADPPYKSLSLYDGEWKAQDRDAKSGAVSTKTIANKCTAVGRFYACEQVVDGKPSSLVLFVARDDTGHYYTQGISPELRAYGRGDLEIQGERWTYSGMDEQNGKTTYFRTTNIFSGPDRIHFELAESSDNQNWTVTRSGDEVRTSKRQ